jgi:hypothetical protein
MGKNNKRNRSNNSTTGLTPLTKTIANMASPNQQQQQQQSFSNLLNQAHETLYTSTPMNTCQRLPLAGCFGQWSQTCCTVITPIPLIIFPHLTVEYEKCSFP